MISLLVVSFVVISLLMVLIWGWARKIDNFSIIDAVWSGSFFLLVVIYFFGANGFFARKVLILTAVGCWSLRLCFFLTKRISSHHPKEDPRYQELRREYAPNIEKRFFWFFQFQAWSVVVLSVPFLMVALNAEPEIQVLEWVGLMVVILAMMGEGVADHQKKVFKENPENKGKNCAVGLWKYSRHPNYFFESFVWVGFFVIAFNSPYGWVTVYCPLVILYLLLKVTGVPISEKNSLAAYGDEYREYVRTTSIFIPWFKRKVNRDKR